MAEHSMREHDKWSKRRSLISYENSLGYDLGVMGSGAYVILFGIIAEI